MASECPDCRAEVAPGAAMCRYCGAELPHVEPPRPPSRLCPRCQDETRPRAIGSTAVRDCPRCAGLWVERTALDRLLADNGKQSELLYLLAAQSLGRGGRTALCPECNALMRQVAFPGPESLKIDQCVPHGIWFDRDELRRMLLVWRRSAPKGPEEHPGLDALGVAVEMLGDFVRR